MRTVNIDNLKEDLVLEEDIRDINGRLLLAKKEKIKSNHIRTFKMWGIFEVSVSGGNGDFGGDGASIDSALMEQVAETTKYHFKHTDIGRCLSDCCR